MKMKFGPDDAAVEHVPPAETLSDVVAENIRDMRKQRGWTVADLAGRCAQLGGDAAGLTENVLENIESGRRKQGRRTRLIAVDELAAIAAAMGVPPSALMPELGDGPLDVPVLFGLDDAEAGMRAALERIDALKARISGREADDGPH